MALSKKMELFEIRPSKSTGNVNLLHKKSDKGEENNDQSSLLHNQRFHSVKTLLHSQSVKSLLESHDLTSTQINFKVTVPEPPSSQPVAGTSKSQNKNNDIIILSEFPKPTPLPKSSLTSKGLPFLWKSLQVIASILLALLTFPILLLVFVLPMMILRLSISVSIYCISQGKIRVLSFIESFTASGSEFYTVVQIIQGECKNLDKIMKKVQKIVKSKNSDSNKFKYPNLQKRLVKKLGFFCFVDHRDDFNVGNHVRYFEDLGFSNEKGMDEDTLFGMLQEEFEYGFSDGVDIDHCSVGGFNSSDSTGSSGYSDGGGDYFGRSPQWEILVVPKFYYKADDGRKYYALIYRANATILDKRTALKIFQDEIVETYETEVGRTLEGAGVSRKFTRMQKLGILFCRLFLGPWWILKDLILKKVKPLGSFKKLGENEDLFAPQYLLNASVAINLPIVKALKELTETSITSILTCCARGAVRNMILGYNLDLPKKYWITIRGFVGKGLESICPFDLSEDKYSFPLERLHRASSALGQKSQGILMESKKEVYSKLFWIAGAFPISICKRLYKRLYGSNILMEIWPLGDEPFRVFGNDLVTDVFAWVSIAGTVADFGVTITSYAGRIRANFLGDNEAIGYNTRRMGLCEEFMEEFIKLAQICNLKPNRLVRDGPIGIDEFGCF